MQVQARREAFCFWNIFFIFGGVVKLQWPGWGGGAQRPVWHVTEPKKTAARSARARTRGQNPLVDNKYIFAVCEQAQSMRALYTAKNQ
jgi:hypothetical protein